MSSKSIFLLVAMSLATTLFIFSENIGFRPSIYTVAQGSVLTIGVVVIIVIVKKWDLVSYRRNYHNREIGNNETFARLLGIASITPRGGSIVVRGLSNRVTAHAYFRISSIPYTLDDLDKDKKMVMVGNFVRILSNLNFGFELVPRVFPVPADVYLRSIQKKIDDLKLTLNAEGKVANPGRQARLRQLERQATRLLEGEGVRDVSFLAHIFVEGKDEHSAVSQLEMNAKTLASALESGLNVRAKRLVNAEMIRVLTEFFPAGVRTVPSHNVRMFSWDLAYIAPLTGPKLPPLEKLLYGTYLGRTSDGTIVCLDVESYPNPHVLVLGKSGYGKSTTVKSFISRSYDLNETSTLIIDYAGEYAPWVQARKGQVIDMHQNSINPFELGPATLTDRIRQLVDAFHNICDFQTINQRNAFTYYAMRAYYDKGLRANDPKTWKNQPPTLEDVIRLMEGDFEKLHITRQMTVMTLLDRLRALASGPFGIFGPSTISIDDLTTGFTCVDLSRITSNSMKDMVAWTVLQYVDSKMRLDGIQKGVRLYVVLDEAWKLCKDEDSLPVTIVKEGRKFGYSLIVSSQDVQDFAESILANAGTIIAHQTGFPKYLNYLRQSYGLSDQELARVQNLPVGEALVKIGNDPRPFFARIEMEQVEAESPATTSQQPAASMDRFNWVLPSMKSVPSVQEGMFRASSEYQGNIRDFIFPDNSLSYDAKLLYSEVKVHPGHKTTDYYRKLGMSPYRGNTAQRELIAHGVIEATELPRLSGKGREGKVLNLRRNDSRRFGGPLHRYLVSRIAQEMMARRHAVDVEYSLQNGGFVDVLIDKTVAVEVETRDFSESNVKKNVEAGFKQIVIVCAYSKDVDEFQLRVLKMGLDPKVGVTTIGKLILNDFADLTIGGARKK